MKMIEEWVILEPTTKPRQCIVALPGRGNSASGLANIVKDMHLPDTLIVALRPQYYAWYPMPISAKDQREAVAGLPEAVAAVEDRIARIKRMWRFKNQNICLVGFSAGSVVSIQTGLLTDDPYKAVVSFAGAILCPQDVPQSDGRNTQFLLQHNLDDNCFDWYERYIPMKSALVSKGYNTLVLEKRFGNHNIMARDIVSVSNHLGRLFGYEDWEHEEAVEYRAMPFIDETQSVAVLDEEDDPSTQDVSV